MKVLDRNAPHSQLEFSFFAEAKENEKRAFSAERKKNLQFFSCPANDNETLFNAQFHFFNAENEREKQSAWNELWCVSLQVCTRMIKKIAKEKKLFYSKSDLYDKAINACEYILRRYKTREKWFVKNNFINVLKHGVLHSMFYHTKSDDLIAFVDNDTFQKMTFYNENE